MYFANNVESILDSVSSHLSADEKQEKVYRVSESLELELALRCLKVPVLEKRLIGHQILTSQIYKVRLSGKQSQSLRQGALNGNMDGLLNKKWLTTELLLAWFDQHRVFDIVFGDSLHSEVIKKSYQMLEFMYINGRI